eukprot:11810006-Alexandrium_andersonii.AAC.1
MNLCPHERSDNGCSAGGTHQSALPVHSTSPRRVRGVLNVCHLVFRSALYLVGSSARAVAVSAATAGSVPHEVRGSLLP